MIFLKILTSSLFLFIIIPPAHAELVNTPFPSWDYVIELLENITEQLTEGFLTGHIERMHIIEQIEKQDKEIKELKKEIKDVKKDTKEILKIVKKLK